MPEELRFSFEGAAIDREAMLREAAGVMDGLGSHLSAAGVASTSSALGREVRDLMGDEARFAVAPDVYPITDETFLAAHLPVPVKFSEAANKFRFYWMRFPIGLAPQRNWAFDRLEVRLEFSAPGAAPHEVPRTIQVLPDRKFQTQLEISDKLEIRLDENMEFAAGTGKLEAGGTGAASAKLDAGVDVKLAGGLGLAAGPFVYKIKRAKIEHNAPGSEWIFWRLDGAEFFQEDSPDLVVVAKIPKTTADVRVAGRLQAYRYFSFASAPLQDAVAHLGERLRNFFQGGLPVCHQVEYNLTPQL